MASLRNSAGTPVDTTALSTLFTFDHIGVVGYSKDFGSLRTGKTARIRQTANEIFKVTSALGAVIWPVAAMSVLPSFGLKKELEDQGAELVAEREKVGSPAITESPGDIC